MDKRKRIILFCGILILAITGVSVALATGAGIYLPLIRSSENMPSPTFDPCKPVPYPIPTAIGCPTATATYSPYPLPPTQTPWIITTTPEPSQTPWLVTVTPIPKIENNVYLPIIEDISE